MKLPFLIGVLIILGILVYHRAESRSSSVQFEDVSTVNEDLIKEKRKEGTHLRIKRSPFWGRVKNVATGLVQKIKNKAKNLKQKLSKKTVPALKNFKLKLAKAKANILLKISEKIQEKYLRTSPKPTVTQKQVIEPKCDSLCVYVGKLLKEMDFYTVAQCSFIVAESNYQESLVSMIKGFRNHSVEKYKTLQSTVIRIEPRFELYDEKLIQHDCLKGFVVQCDSNEEANHPELQNLVCDRPCPRVLGCQKKKKLVEQLIKAAHDAYLKRLPKTLQILEEHTLYI